MKSFWLVILFGFALLPPLRAQSEADDKYISIYSVIQQAENQVRAGEPREALANYVAVQAQLQRFHRLFPDWNPGIINFRLDEIAKKITALSGSAAATNPPPATASANAAQTTAQIQDFQSQLQAARAENETLQAKLKEALAAQPAAIDASELVRAQTQIRSLMKENDLLKARPAGDEKLRQSQPAGPLEAAALAALREQNAKLQAFIANTTNALAQAQSDLQSYAQRYATEHDRAEKLAARTNGTELVKLSAELSAARSEIAALKSTAAIASLEKSRLEGKVRQLTTELADRRAANFEARLRDLTEQRDELRKQLTAAEQKNSRRLGAGVDSQLAALNDEVKTLRARLAVDEAKPVPFVGDELALFRQTAPPAKSATKSVSEMPAGSGELVASAQQHFVRHEYDLAEADYQKILDRDQNNGLALANLATIELQQGKLDAAEKHLKAALAQSPDDAFNLATLGYLKFQQAKYDDALDLLSRAAQLDPQNPEIQNYLGVTLSHKGQRLPAETALRRAIQINPLYAPAHNNLAVIYLSQTPASPLLARWHYQKALAGGQPRNPDLEKMLADKGAPVDPP